MGSSRARGPSLSSPRSSWRRPWCPRTTFAGEQRPAADCAVPEEPSGGRPRHRCRRRRLPASEGRSRAGHMPRDQTGLRGPAGASRSPPRGPGWSDVLSPSPNTDRQSSRLRTSRARDLRGGGRSSPASADHPGDPSGSRSVVGPKNDRVPWANSCLSADISRIFEVTTSAAS